MKEGKTYTLSAKKSDIIVGGRISVFLYDESDNISNGYTLVGFSNNDTTSAITFTVPIGTKYSRFSFISDCIDITNGLQTDIYNIQLELGSTATAYEKHKESNTNVELTLNSLSNDIMDEYDISTGLYINRVKTVILNGSALVPNWKQGRYSHSRLKSPERVLTQSGLSYLDSLDE